MLATALVGIKVLSLQEQIIHLMAADLLESLDTIEEDIPKGGYDVIKNHPGMYLLTHLVPLFLDR
jgi:hypothetical protein